MYIPTCVVTDGVVFAFRFSSSAVRSVPRCKREYRSARWALFEIGWGWRGRSVDLVKSTQSARWKGSSADVARLETCVKGCSLFSPASVCVSVQVYAFLVDGVLLCVQEVDMRCSEG